MRIFYSEHFLKAYQDAPSKVQGAFDKQARFLVANLRHPSLDCKKYNGNENIWQARVNRNWRFYFKIVEDMYLLLDVIPHPK